ncbi:unnamed protein product [Orchesella dallaii]|uniref:Uncharacterized protein n=1 Tax=Orchesella dallaii TaxID=48710 RepID=A0ABP1PUM6_9HEXA
MKYHFQKEILLILAWVPFIYSQVEPLKAEYVSPSGWLRICQGKEYIGVVSTTNDECPAGYWFKEPLKVGCACGHGVWVFSKGWCDHKARIILAKDGSCFSIDQDVRYIRYLGWSGSAYLPYHFVASSGLEYVQPLPESMTMPSAATNFHVDYDQHIGAVFREKAVESMTGRVCLSQAGNVSRPLSFKYFVSKLPYSQKKSCFSYPNQDQGRFEYDVGYDIGSGINLVDNSQGPFTQQKSWADQAANDKCKLECTYSLNFNNTGPENHTLGPELDYWDPDFDEYFQEDLREIGWTNMTAFPNITQLKNQTCDEQRATYNLTQKTTTEIVEQTKRMIQANLLTSILPVGAGSGYKIEYKDYNLMQKSRKIFAKVCSEMPTKVLEGMHKMFRVALSESFFHYPYKQITDDSETEEIGKLLETCYSNAREMNFVFADLPPPPATAVPAKADPFDPSSLCPEQKFWGVQYGFPDMDATKTEPINKTIKARLPCHLWSNITDLDLVVETAWKTVMFTHYYCARHFKKENNLRFGLYQQKMEKFFNRWIQHRWFYPGPALNGYKFLFQMFDLEKYAKTIDRCVAAARSFSVYRKWISRPVYSKHLGGKLFEDQYDIPDDIAGRTDLDAINPKLIHFNNKAYCLPYWHAPASNPALNYDPSKDYKQGCVKYRQEEWKDPFTPVLGKADGWRNNIDIV